VAVFRALQLGDLLCAVPALRALRAAWPRARITLVGLPWARDFVRRMPYLDRFIEFPGAPGLPERDPDSEHWPTFIAEVRARRFDLAIQLHGSGELTNALVAEFGAARSAGFVAPGHANPDPRSYLAWPEHLPEVRRLLALTHLLGAPSCGEHLELPVLPAERRAFAALRARLPIRARGYVCVHPGARLATRRWPPARFGAVADRLARSGFSVLLTGTSSEAPLAAEVRAAMREPAIDLTGRTTLGTLTALVAQARLVVCNDTGMSHVAAAVGTPSVVVCCGADPARWRPLDAARHRVVWHDVACRPCSHEYCPTGHECALGVDPTTVGTQALSLLTAREDRHVAR
jgi:lipopolysaccharide heptosyltransferase II